MAFLPTLALRALNTTKPLLPPKLHSQKVGVVVSAGLMAGAVKVRVAERAWNKKFRKYFPAPHNYLVRDPNSSLVPGDVVRITSGHRTSKRIRHVVTAIVAPFGEPVENRPKVMTQEELDEERVKEQLLKDRRRSERGRVVSQNRLRQAKKQGLQIPTLEEAMRGMRMYEEKMKELGVGQGKKDEKHQGQVGQQMTQKQKRMEERKKTKEEQKAEEKVKRARMQTES
ncbi:nucleic acid-binding protein [Ophiobolus disseminans]|uniref:Nucleic acid-binding protein n=1 Tax=Ophiobolus disseminans TaxID=1469910 RepID=A0A6A6ZFA7_9PLEO|nr:nucleic acid-binding protein [Ophiobolus disseminans]